MKTNSKRTLGMERLESRELMAGNVWASVTGGSLQVVGSDNAEAIQISQTGSGQYRVTGQNGTRVNGHAAVTASGITRDVIVYMHGGNDVVTIGGGSNSSRMVAPANVFVYGGVGNDQIVLRNLNVGGTIVAHGGHNNDTIVVENTSANGDLFVHTSDQNQTNRIETNRVFVSNVSVGNTDPRHRRAGRLQVMGTGGVDEAYIDRTSADIPYADLEGGNDFLSVRNSSIRGSANLMGDNGHDSLSWFNNYFPSPHRPHHTGFESVSANWRSYTRKLWMS